MEAIALALRCLGRDLRLVICYIDIGTRPSRRHQDTSVTQSTVDIRRASFPKPKVCPDQFASSVLSSRRPVQSRWEGKQSCSKFIDILFDGPIDPRSRLASKDVITAAEKRGPIGASSGVQRHTGPCKGLGRGALGLPSLKYSPRWLGASKVPLLWNLIEHL